MKIRSVFLIASVGCVLLSSSVVMLWSKPLLETVFGENTKGTVVDLVANESHRRGHPLRNEAYAPLIEWKGPDGGVRRFKHVVSTDAPVFEVGDRVTVRYSPSNLDGAAMDGWCLLIEAAIAVVAGVLPGLMAITFFAAALLVKR